MRTLFIYTDRKAGMLYITQLLFKETPFKGGGLTSTKQQLSKMKQYDDLFKRVREDVKAEVEKYNKLYSDYRAQYPDTYELPNIKIVNIVISTEFDRVDIPRLKQDVNCEYYPKQFPGFVYRQQNPKSAMLLFATGKVICTGIRNIEDAYRTLQSFKDNYKVEQSKPITVQNLVVSVDFQYYIALEDAVNQIPRAIYEPEQFPGIIYRNIDPKSVFLLFTKGKCICVGTSKIEDAFKTVFYVRKILIDNDLFIPKD